MAGGSSARSSKPSIRTPHSSFMIEVHRADHAVAAALAQPARRGVEQRVDDLLIILEVEKAEEAPAVVWKLLKLRVVSGR